MQQQAEMIAVPDHIKEHIASRTKHLDMVPAIATRALEISNDPECSIEEFCTVVQKDPMLATNTLTLANSAMYSPKVPVASLSQAVFNIGFQQCRNLIMASSMSALMKDMDLGEEWAQESLCRHGYATGLLAVKINRALNIGILGEEFTAGLIHDFGRMLFVLCFPDEFRKFDDLAFEEETQSVLATEEAILQVNHCELGAWLLQSNGLPEVLVEVVRFHHQPELATDTRLTYLIAVCDHMANHLHRHGSTQSYDLETNPFIQGLEDSGVRFATSRVADIAGFIMESTLVESDQFNS